MMQYITTPDYYNDYISHHGILNQKWGVRNGPPYPLDSKIFTGSRLKSGGGSKTTKHRITNSLHREDISDGVVKKYNKQFRNLNRVRVNKSTKGYIYSKNGTPYGMVNTEKKDNGVVWIQGLEVFGNQKGKGLGKELLDIAVKDLGATNLSVNKYNEVAINMCNKYGFKTYKKDDVMLYMKVKRKLK